MAVLQTALRNKQSSNNPCTTHPRQTKCQLEHGADADADVDSCGNRLSIAENGSEQQAEAIALLRSRGARDGEWVAATPEKIAERLADESFQPGVDWWSGSINSVLQCDDLSLLEKFVERFGVQRIRELNPTNGWRIPRSETMLSSSFDTA